MPMKIKQIGAGLLAVVMVVFFWLTREKKAA